EHVSCIWQQAIPEIEQHRRSRVLPTPAITCGFDSIPASPTLGMAAGNKCVPLLDEAFQEMRIDAGTTHVLRPPPIRMPRLVDGHGCSKHAAIEVEKREVLEIAVAVVGV